MSGINNAANEGFIIKIKEPVSAQTIVKKSRFICDLFITRTDGEREAALNSVKKKYYDAKHWCYASVTGPDNSERKSDGGEPQGTAGEPMLNVLKGAGISDITAVTTRYFGGILLGAGGLSRAYAASVKEALNKARLVKLVPADILVFETDYTGYGKIKSAAARYGALEKAAFGKGVTVEITVDKLKAPSLSNKISEMLGGFKPKRAGETFIEEDIN